MSQPMRQVRQKESFTEQGFKSSSLWTKLGPTKLFFSNLFKLYITCSVDIMIKGIYIWICEYKWNLHPAVEMSDELIYEMITLHSWDQNQLIVGCNNWWIKKSALYDSTLLECSRYFQFSVKSCRRSPCA